jgi:hypothetical protein
MPPRPIRATRVIDPILLWILIHGGDPAPDDLTRRLTAALAIRDLASNLGASAQKEIRQIIGKEIGEAAGGFARG